MTGARRELWLLSGLFALEFVLLGLRPVDRGAWLLENLLVLLAVVGIAWSARHRPLSRGAYRLIFAFLALHEVGSHYTYSRVPYDAWAEALTGETLSALFGWQRNHYDRLIHLGFGLCLACPLREILAGAARARPRVMDALALLGMLGLSALYEQLEFWAARLIDPELGLAFVGAQGDPWDAQQDTSLALAGSAAALALRAWFARRGRRVRLGGSAAPGTMVADRRTR